MNEFYSTADEAKDAIAGAIEAGGSDVASRAEFDLDAIHDEVHAYEPGRGFRQTVDAAGFWDAVQRYAR